MKIVYLIHSLNATGGMERILTSKANWLSAQPDTEVFIITSHMRSRKPFFELDPRIHLLDANVNERMRGREYRHRLQAMLDEIRPDISISLCASDVFHLHKCHNAGAKIAEYHFLHDKFFKKYPKSPLYAAYRTKKLEAALKCYDVLVVLSQYDLDYFKGISPQTQKLVKIGNTIPELSETLSDQSQKRFICVGRLATEKNFEDAIKIWKIVLRGHPDWILDIYGDGEKRKQLQSILAKEGLEKQISLKGNVTSIMEEYKQSSGLLVTSRYEGFGLMIIEAGSCGIPVVAYKCPGGVRELITDGENGYLVEEDDIEVAAERISMLIENKELRKELGRNAYDKAKEYLPETIMSQWVELFNDLKK